MPIKYTDFQGTKDMVSYGASGVRVKRRVTRRGTEDPCSFPHRPVSGKDMSSVLGLGISTVRDQ